MFQQWFPEDKRAVRQVETVTFPDPAPVQAADVWDRS